MAACLVPLLVGALTQQSLARRVNQGSTALEVSDASEGPIASRLIASFKVVDGVAPGELKVKKLQEALLAAGSAFTDFGFGSAATETNKNAKLLSACPDFNAITVDACLKNEEGKHTPQDKVNGKPARLNDPSPAVGFIWSTRILGFMAEMMHIVSTSSTTIHNAGMSAYELRIKPSFRKCVLCLDAIVSKVVYTALALGFSGTDQYYYDRLGGKEVAQREMKEFARIALPVADGIREALGAHNLDDTPCDSKGKCVSD
jgi:hypothetical protein